MTDLEIIKISLENSLEIIGQKMNKSSNLISNAKMLSKYIPFIESGGYGYSESKKKEELERLRNEVTFHIIKAMKIIELIHEEINPCINILQNNKKAFWYSSLFNKITEIKKKLNDQIFDGTSLKNKFGNKNINFKNIILEEDEYEIDEFNIIGMGINLNDFHFAFFDNLREKYGKSEKSNIEIIDNEYTQRSSSFDLNRKLRKG